MHHRKKWAARTSGIGGGGGSSSDLWFNVLDSTHFRKEVLPLVTCSGNPGEISTVGLSRSCSLLLLDQKTSKAGMQRRSGPPRKIA